MNPKFGFQILAVKTAMRKAPPGFVRKSEYHKNRETSRHYVSRGCFVLLENSTPKLYCNLGMPIASNSQLALSLLRTSSDWKQNALQDHGPHGLPLACTGKGR